MDTATATVPFPLLTRKNYTGFFVQDDWKALPKLTVNLGLRWEWQSPPAEGKNHQSIVNLATPNPGAGGLPGALTFASASNRRLFPTDYSAIGPRVGLAYQLTPNTVVRAGYGVYYSEMMPNTDIVNSGFSDVGSFANLSGSVSPVFVLSSGVPSYTAAQSISPTTLNGTTGSYYGPNMGAHAAHPELQPERAAPTHQELPARARLCGRPQHPPGSAQHGEHQPGEPYLSLARQRPAHLLRNRGQPRQGGHLGPLCGFSGTIAQALRPFPQYSTLTSVAAKAGASEYNSGQIVYRIRAWRGLTLNTNYTYSKLMGYANQDARGQHRHRRHGPERLQPQADWSLLPNDVRHALVLDATYELPFGTAARCSTTPPSPTPWPAAGASPRSSGTRAGFPLSLLMNTNALPIFNTYQRPNIVPGVDPSSHTPNGRFNPAAGSNLFNPCGLLGAREHELRQRPATYSNLRNYPVLAEDLAVLKSTQFREHLGWTFYAQAFNAFNRHRFAGFGTALRGHQLRPAERNQRRACGAVRDPATVLTRSTQLTEANRRGGTSVLPFPSAIRQGPRQSTGSSCQCPPLAAP